MFNELLKFNIYKINTTYSPTLKSQYNLNFMQNDKNLSNIKLNFSINNMLNKVYAVASRPAGLRPGQPRVIKFGVRLDL